MGHDFTMAMMHTLAREQNMPAVEECVKAIEVLHLKERQGVMQMLFEPTIEGKTEGFQTFIESKYLDWPTSMVTCYYAAKNDKQSIKTFFDRLSTGSDEIFWSHLDTWATAHTDMKEFLG